MTGMEIAILGLPQSGKTTVFNALTRGAAESPSKGAPVGAIQIGVVKVPDPRLEALGGLFRPQKVVPAEITYWDLPPVREEAVAKGISGVYLNQLQKADGLMVVVRAFQDPSVPHLEGSVDPHRDAETMLMELAFSDLAILERRLERLRLNLKGAKASEREAIQREEAFMQGVRQALERGVPIREQPVRGEPLLANYQFLTAKPLLLLFNVGEEALADLPNLEGELCQRYQRPGVGVAALCAKLEAELSQLSPEEEQEFRQSLGLKGGHLERVVRLSLELLEQVCFFTGGPKEVRAWTITRGTPAVKAAGRIHSDMERGFIRAEVVTYSDLMAAGSMAEARRRGVLRMEGKGYQVQDGDVITFLFNV